MKRFLALYAPLALFLWMLLPISVQALSVSPMSLYIDPTDSGAYRTVIARNTSDQTIALETFVEARVVGADGQLRLDRNEEDFLVFPPLATLAPGASQAFRVQWIGDLGPRPSAVYYVTVFKLPIKLNNGNTASASADQTSMSLKLGYAFKVSVGVAPRGSKPNLTAQALGPGVRLPDGRPTISVRFTNDGRGYTQLSNFSYAVTKPGGQNYTTAFDDWADRAGTSLFPAGHARVVDIPVPDASWISGVVVDPRPTR